MLKALTTSNSILKNTAENLQFFIYHITENLFMKFFYSSAALCRFQLIIHGQIITDQQSTQHACDKKWNCILTMGCNYFYSTGKKKRKKLQKGKTSSFLRLSLENLKKRQKINYEGDDSTKNFSQASGMELTAGIWTISGQTHVSSSQLLRGPDILSGCLRM